MHNFSHSSSLLTDRGITEVALNDKDIDDDEEVVTGTKRITSTGCESPVFSERGQSV